MQHNRYCHNSSHGKSVEAVLAFKKSCGNTIKLATKNIPHAVIQVSVFLQLYEFLRTELTMKIYFQAVIISVYFFGMVTILARDMSYDDISHINRANGVEHTSNVDFGQQGVPSLLGNSTMNVTGDNFVSVFFSYFPLIPGMQVRILCHHHYKFLTIRIVLTVLHFFFVVNVRSSCRQSLRRRLYRH